MQTKTPEADEGDLFYGKMLYEDRNNVLWAADNSQIFKQTPSGEFELTFSNFDLINEAQNRSFQLVENIDGELFAFHHTGVVLKYDEEANQFRDMKANLSLVV